MAANIYEKNSKEWKNSRNKIRADWKEEKDTGTVNNNYDIDHTGSHDKGKTPPSKQISQKQTVSDAQKQHGGGGSTGSSMGKGRSPSDAPGSPF
jgi:hypothetical protein